MKYEKEIEIVKKALHTKLWRETDDQLDKWDYMLNELSEYHEVDKPQLVINENIDWPYYDKITKFIHLNKFSIISFLHEFGHHIGLNEKQCIDFSETIFLTAYPKAQKYLIRDDRGYLVKLGGGQIK